MPREQRRFGDLHKPSTQALAPMFGQHEGCEQAGVLQVHRAADGLRDGFRRDAETGRFVAGQRVPRTDVRTLNMAATSATPACRTRGCEGEPGVIQ